MSHLSRFAAALRPQPVAVARKAVGTVSHLSRFARPRAARLAWRAARYDDITSALGTEGETGSRQRIAPFQGRRLTRWLAKNALFLAELQQCPIPQGVALRPPQLRRVAAKAHLGLAAGGTPQVYLSCRTTALDGHSLAKASDASPFDVFVFAEAGDRPSLRALQGPAVVPDTALAVWVDAVVARSSGLRPPTTDAASG